MRMTTLGPTTYSTATDVSMYDVTVASSAKRVYAIGNELHWFSASPAVAFDDGGDDVTMSAQSPSYTLVPVDRNLNFEMKVASVGVSTSVSGLSSLMFVDAIDGKNSDTNGSDVSGVSLATLCGTSLSDDSVTSSSFAIDVLLGDDKEDDFIVALPEVAIIGTLVSIAIIAIVIGNAFVVASVIVYREMRTLTNWMIVSLATADILVAVGVLPLSAYQEVVGGRWRLGGILCDFWTTADVFCCTASILNIAAIALDRYWLITRNVAYTHAHRMPRRRACRLMAALAWTTAGVISAAPLLGWRTGEENDSSAGICRISQDYAYTIFSTFGAFWLPLAVIIIVYGKIFWIAQRRLRRRMRQHYSSAAAIQTGLPVSPCRQVSNANAVGTRGATSAAPATLELLPPDADAKNRRRFSLLRPISPLFQQRRASVPTPSRHPSTPAAVAETNLLPVSRNLLATPSSCTGPDLRLPALSSCLPESAAAATDAGVTRGLSTRRRNAASAGSGPGTSAANGIVSYRKCQYRRMRNSARMLGLIIGGFVMCWLPFFLLATAVPFCGESCDVPAPVSSVALWLGYSNSLLNPVIYAIWDHNFRNCFRRLATCDLTGGRGRGGAGAAVTCRRTQHQGPSVRTAAPAFGGGLLGPGVQACGGFSTPASPRAPLSNVPVIPPIVIGLVE